jgi:hypothetical protein
MDENLVGYLLKVLDDDTRHGVEDYLRHHPEAQTRLDSLRRALEPLEADRADPEPPPGLWVRTLARVAEHTCRQMPAAPVIRAPRAATPRRQWWARPDALVAAGILLCVGMLVPPGLVRIRYEYQKAACKNNLQQIGAALIRYTDLDHGAFPNVADHPEPRNVAGLFIPTLVNAGVLRPDQISVSCPATGVPVRPRWTLEELQAMPREEFERIAPELSPHYAYTLGYHDRGRVAGIRRADGVRPIVSDRPPLGPGAWPQDTGNSFNHGGRGQNILYTDGQVRFSTVRHVDGDDVYLNEARQPAAGLHRRDNVLGASFARPGRPPVAQE